MSSIIIRGRAPLRVSFAGGGTDISSYFEKYGGCVLSCTIAKYTYASLMPNDNHSVTIESLDYGEPVIVDCDSTSTYDGKLDLAKAAVRSLGISEGCRIVIRSDVPPGSGLGASGALAATMIGVIMRWRHVHASWYDLAELAYRIERDELGVKGGKQDQFAAVFGGFNFIEFYRDCTVVNPLRISPDTVNELSYRGVLCYTKRSLDGPTIIDDQMTSLNSGSEDVAEAMHAAKGHAIAMKKALLLGKIDEFGELLAVSWENKKLFSSKITTPGVEELYEYARRHGAMSGKLLGAGGGGYMLLFCEAQKRHVLTESLKRIGVQIESLSIEREGLSTWTV